jgi:uncharacterized membrane protein
MAKKLSAQTVSLLAIMTAVTTVLTLLVRIPFAPTRGYITLADVGVYFSAFALGPVIGGIAAGVGTGLADAIAGYPQWMVLTFIIHGLQAVMAGYIARKGTLPLMIAGWAVGAIIMIAGYFAAGAALYGAGPAAAEIIGNAGQVVAGGLIGIPLVFAVRKAYPPIMNIGKSKSWESADETA